MTAPEPYFLKDQDGGLWYPTSNDNQTNPTLSICSSGNQHDVLRSSNLYSNSP
ncbi:unnamed protein product, partial [Callosobruchus maculatus]